jgi:chorismate mutase
MNRQAYCAALAEASSELEQLSIEIQALVQRRSRVEKAVAMLKGQIDPSRSSSANIVVWKRALKPGLKIQTRVSLKDAGQKPSN